MVASAELLVRQVNEVSVEEDGVSLCFLVQQSNRSLRIIDFRAGLSGSKRRVVLDFARERGMQRLFTLVERDEVSAWSRLGFEREGTVPGYYKRSDAYLLGTLLEWVQAPSDESGTRLAVRSVKGSRNGSENEGPYQAARRLAKKRAQQPHVGVKVLPSREGDVKRARAAAGRGSRSLTSFEPFSRDAERWYFTCTARGGFSLLVGVETQPCFDNAFIEPLTAPRSDKEAVLTVAALGRVCELLRERGIVACFSLQPVDQLELNAAFYANGFRRTGNLKHHVLSGPVRKDAFLWSQRLALPGVD